MRGGHIFDNTEEFLDDLLSTPGLDDLGDLSSAYGAVGYRAKLARAGASMFALEGEVVVARGSIDVTDGVLFAEFTEWDVAPQLNLRWQYNFHRTVAPYASVGVGPTFAFYEIDSSFGGISGDDVLFSYNGRAGLEFSITNRFGIEGGYRYFGVTEGVTVGFHAAEVGLNFKF